MSTSAGVSLQTFTSGADLSSALYHFLKHDGSTGMVLCDTAGEFSNVVCYQTTDAASKAFGGAVSGFVKIEAGGTVGIGDNVTTNASGEAIEATTSGHEILGTAMTAGVDGDIIEVHLAYRGTVA